MLMRYLYNRFYFHESFADVSSSMQRLLDCHLLVPVLPLKLYVPYVSYSD